MPDIIDVSILAIIQGLTEFLPVSSSGHLALGSHFLSFQSPGIVLEVLLHAGTLLAVIAYYHRKLWDIAMGCLRFDKPSLYFALCVALSMIPAAIFGLTGEAYLSKLSEEPTYVAALLIFSGCVLVLGKLFSPKVDAHKSLSIPRAILIGLAQMVAVLPGVSRSGMTITASRILGMNAKDSAAFSFIMVIPLILGATLLKVIQACQVGEAPIPMSHMAIGFTLAAIVGYLSVAVMVKLLDKNRFWLFGIYTIVAGGLFLLNH